jgi:fermentation-respiration switch protein FrsA (DUF1100 family)
MNTPLKAPPRFALVREARVIGDALHMARRLLLGAGRAARATPQISTDPVITLPGFGAGEFSMRALRGYLARHGVQSEDWGLGRNLAGLDIPHRLEDVSAGWELEPLPRYRREGGVSLLCDRMVGRVRRRADETGQRFTLIGWSLGGTIAREVARDAPDCVARVITLGSPVIGGPKYTAAAGRLARRGLDIDWIERQVERRARRPITVPVTAIVSPSDGVVGYGAAIDDAAGTVEHRVIDISHLGMPINPQVWDAIVEVLGAGRGPGIAA